MDDLDEKNLRLNLQLSQAVNEKNRLEAEL